MSLGRKSSFDEADAVALETDCICPGTRCQRRCQPSRRSFAAASLEIRFPTPPRVMPFVLVSTLRVRHLESLSPMLVTFQIDDRCLESDFQALRSK
jgi:hypothetical protein